MSDKLKVLTFDKKDKEKPEMTKADEVLAHAKGFLSDDMIIIGFNIDKTELHIITPCKDKQTIVYMCEAVKTSTIMDMWSNG